jgi:hypothetical protein
MQRCERRLSAWVAVGVLAVTGTLAAACGGGSSPKTRDGGADGKSNDAESSDGGRSDGNAPGDGGSTSLVPGYLKSVATSSLVYTTNFGSPYDSILGAPMQVTQSAIAPGFKTEPGLGLVGSTYTLQEVDTTQDLYSALNVSGSLSVMGAVNSASAKMSYAQSTTIDTSKVYIFVDATAAGLTEQISNAQLSSAAAALSASDFYALYGDRYAAQIVTGAEFFGMIEVSTTSEEDKRTLQASLQLTYGPATLTGSTEQDLMTKLTGHQVKVTANAVGATVPPIGDTVESFLSAASNFLKAYATDGGANTSTQALNIIYASYYGLAGYPGVPAGTDVKVSQHAQAVSDYLLYNSLVQNDFAAYYTDTNYNTLPFLTGMKSYRDALGSYLTASLANSQSLPALPAPAASGKIETYTTSSATAKPNGAGASPQFVVHTIDNGFIPKRLSDYEIPLRYIRYSGPSTINGANFAALVPMQSSQSATVATPLIYQLYPVNKAASGAAANLALSYQWDTGTYMIPGGFSAATATSGPAPDPTQIASLLEGSGFKIYDPGSGIQPNEFVLLNKATGLALTDHAGAIATLEHFNSANASGTTPTQIWGFGLACSPGVTTPWASGGLVEIQSDADKLWIDFQGGSASAQGVAMQTYTFTCADEQRFNLLPKDSGGTWAFQGYNGYSNLYLESQTTMASAQFYAQPLSNATAYDDQLWVMIPAQDIDTP